MSVIISDEALQAARLSAAEMKQEIAVLLFQRNKLTLGQASQLAEISQVSFPTSVSEPTDSAALSGGGF